MTGVPAWKTKVEYSSTRRAERGEIDNEKAAGLEHSPVRVENAETKA